MSSRSPVLHLRQSFRLLILVALTWGATPCVALLAQTDDPATPAPVPPAPDLPAPETAAPDAATPDDFGAGDTDASADKPYWRTNLFGRFFRDQKFLFTNWWPSEIRHPWFTGPVLAGVALATTSNNHNQEGPDAELGDYTKAEATGSNLSMAHRFSFVGNTGPGVLLIGAGYLIGRWSHHDRLEEATSLSAEALLSTGLYTTVLKHITARTRPANGGNGSFFEFSPQDGQVASSFPSGHAASAFSVAAVFAGVYSDHRWAPYVAYGTAGLIGWSRLALHRHFPSDILVGAMVGSSIGRMTVARSREKGEPVASIEPFFDPDGHGGGLIYTRRW